jgi:predicted dehydrogenase
VLRRQLQQEWQPRKAYHDDHQLLADSDVNAVETLLAHHLHREVVIAALKAGKHVSLLKPPTLTLRDLNDVNEAAKAAGRDTKFPVISFDTIWKPQWTRDDLPAFRALITKAHLGMLG